MRVSLAKKNDKICIILDRNEQEPMSIQVDKLQIDYYTLFLMNGRMNGTANIRICNKTYPGR